MILILGGGSKITEEKKEIHRGDMAESTSKTLSLWIVNADLNLTPETPVKNDPNRRQQTPDFERQLSCRRNVRRRGEYNSGFKPVLESVCSTTDVNNVRMMEQPVKHSCGYDRVVHQLAPVAEILVACQDYSAVLVAFTD